MLSQETSPEIHLVVLSAYGITREPVASNRIYGLISGLSSLVSSVTLVSVAFPDQTLHDYESLEGNVEVRSISPSGISKFLKRFRKRSAKKKPLQAGFSVSKAKSGFWKKAMRTFLVIFSAESYLVPALRLLISAFRVILRRSGKNAKVFLFASSGPASIALLAWLLKVAFRKKIFLIQDFRDPIAENVYIKEGTLNGALKWIERKAVDSADAVTAVSKYTLKLLCKKPKRAYVLYNGYTATKKLAKNASGLIPNSIGYFGSVYSARVHPLKNLALALKSTDFTLYYAGKHSQTVREVFAACSCSENLKDLGMLSREDALDWEERMQILLILKTEDDKGVLTGKFFEYITTERPVLVIGSADDEFNEIAERVGGVFVVPDNAELIQQALNQLKEVFSAKRNKKEVASFEWKNLSARFFREVLLKSL